MVDNQPPDNPDKPPWAQATELASERLFDIAVDRFGGRRTATITEIVPGFENADWVFETQKVIVEHKSIETEVTRTSKFRAEYKRIVEKVPESERRGLAIGKAIQPFLAQIAKKANRQIRATAKRLGWENYSGVLILANRDFIALPPALIVTMMGDLLLRHYSQITAFVYVTDHYVEIRGSDLANILWSPQYHPDAPDTLQPFINDFGATFFQILEEEIGPFDESSAGENPEWLDTATPITEWRRS